MHLEVVRDRPGSCPICGMGLEPRAVSAREEENPELRAMTRRLLIGVLLTAPLFLLEMSHMLPGRAGGPPAAPGAAPYLSWIQLVLATPVVMYCGWPFFERGWASVANRSPNMFTLIALGTGAAYLYSVAATAAPGIFPPSA